MVQYNPLSAVPSPLPTAEELPETDHQPVDNELQVLLPTLLRGILSLLWSDRGDWFFGINIGLYYEPRQAAIGPDALLSLGVERYKSDRGRLSYVLWEEGNIVPGLVLEIVSKAPGGEYDTKFSTYLKMGVLYYVIYNPDYAERDRHASFEVYKQIAGEYVLQAGQPVWMPEIGLGIGVQRGTHDGLTRDWLYWYNEQGDRYPAPDDAIAQERRRTQQAQYQAEQAQQQAERAEQHLQQERLLREQEQRLREELLRKLREQGIDPDRL